ncbi:ASCH domain-containing protein [Liquorilactobacillus oeni]|uniref:ASCH domain-containing protein n=1 Tax=Liquorilactobacillus oeni DSM 19972 TaxID=1423777 RepID=A0A0R1M8T3_9LACO|nr:ASCH domain-containing protein [Liquorilactobacillus oeni]KRL04559.1 hypothetical protein FD46_GL001690 [Liquorilactobacillus oeni DSM 19972]
MKKIENYWKHFKDSNGISATHYSAYAFGWPAKMQDELAALVVKEIKTATTSALALYEPDEEKPFVGEYNIILDGKENPVCITQTKIVEAIPFNLISQEHAYHEGEGDRSYQFWRKAHEDFFGQEFEKAKKSFKEDTLCLCEVFQVVYK